MEYAAKSFRKTKLLVEELTRKERRSVMLAADKKRGKGNKISESKLI